MSIIVHILMHIFVFLLFEFETYINYATGEAIERAYFQFS